MLELIELKVETYTAKPTHPNIHDILRAHLFLLNFKRIVFHAPFSWKLECRYKERAFGVTQSRRERNAESYETKEKNRFNVVSRRSNHVGDDNNDKSIEIKLEFSHHSLRHHIP